MALTSGTRLGPYEIESLLGVGGMGEVYRAKDTRLDRPVALKVLPDGIATDAPHRARFQQEARIISALNHAHICALHDVGQIPGWGSTVSLPMASAASASVVARAVEIPSRSCSTG